MNEVKKARLIWKEKIPDGTDAIPMLSFDNGINWISMKKTIQELKSGLLDIDYGSSIVKIDSEWSNIDISVPFAPETIPYLSDASTLFPVSKVNVSDYLDAGIYYIAISANTNNSIGYQDINDNSIKYDLNFSKLFKIEVPSRDEASTERFLIDLYIQYPDYIDGICIYMGKDNTTSDGETTVNIVNTGQLALDLIYVSNISGILAENYNTATSNIIKLKDSQNFPKSGVVKIGNHFVEYENKEYDFTDPTNKKTILYVKRRISLEDSNIIYNTDTIVNLKDFNLGENYSSLPPKVYPVIDDKNNTSIYLTFDNKNLTDLGKDNKNINDIDGVVLKNNKNQVIEDTVYNYSDKTPKINGNSINMNGSFIIDPRIQLTDISGLVNFYFMIDKTPLHDICIFGNNEGLSLYISAKTLKPYLILNNEVVTNIYDSRLNTITINNWFRYSITWTTTNNIKNILFFIDGYLAITLTLDNKNLGYNLYIGGINSIISGDTVFKDIFSGYIDDFRVYTVDKDISFINKIHTDLLNNQNRYSGKIRISKRMDLNESLQANIIDNTIDFSQLTSDIPDFPRLFNSNNIVVYKNGIKLIQDTDYTISSKIITLTESITEKDIVKVYSNEINSYFPGTFIPQINTKILFDEQENNKNNCISCIKCISRVLDSSLSVIFNEEESNGFIQDQIFYIIINTENDVWEYINDYTYTYSAKKIDFSVPEYAEKQIKIYTDSQNSILSDFSTRLLLIGEDLDNVRIANPINVKSLKIKFDLESNSIFSTPEIKDFGVIISNFSMQ